MKENKFNRLKPNTNNFYLIVYSKTILCFQIFVYLILAEKAAHSSSTKTFRKNHKLSSGNLRVTSRHIDRFFIQKS